ncbi:MAG: DNA-directed RNA polymerase subunit alpha [Candidatus Brennerbacteria bacterium RIFOXYC1_FULL_41_11]|uniref:DNA-directed RNA polymerase subunit alpha n=1 Tax=Candidatus Brennerbacteria bacterium RIFOXYD1_FULL_41_16 TaxID=1797529 RepID=A0A1G1XLS4_9BACT|nr:MAG: DNA-directed RNA polymerase subunit alpha [Parcubacteria group bacterium GW2011_GWB1_41_4]OGY38829.1 MAG: DNA-directed RNA polymerase subunit alpha [Candidatus Brennerbacteria bacterium RIFOXYB1_FULL_41_13]OGY39110.1 MAG: DNA-directed RNA polymerase subunit alpha [Candidatus Brennerbacteria bacterium RIFOXYC1_FULL_41_11]OGY40267.1 MAG: DNA-directed RNA polymerase subunit alpha [Candidatus Brennerbacteria bacterium RIFOXYD1_FULL_41_16]
MISLPQKVNVVSHSETDAVIEIEGLHPGYGLTLGTALRRVLLSSCEGAAVVSFRLNNAPHEFSSLPGVKEDLVEISLNLKKLRFRVFGDEPQVLTVVAKGEREIRAKDIAKNSSVEIVNPEAVIATLTDKKAVFELELIVEKGIGYSTIEERRRKEKLPIGMIEIDSNFSPLSLVNLEIENMRVGEKTNYNRLRLTIKADGSLDPLLAFDHAINILVGQFSALKAEENETEEGPTSFSSLKDGSEVSSVVLEETSLSGRVLAVLKQHRIKTVGDLGKTSVDKIRAFKGLGDKAVEEIQEVAKEYGIVLK